MYCMFQNSTWIFGNFLCRSWSDPENWPTLVPPALEWLQLPTLRTGPFRVDLVRRLTQLEEGVLQCLQQKIMWVNSDQTTNIHYIYFSFSPAYFFGPPTWSWIWTKNQTSISLSSFVMHIRGLTFVLINMHLILFHIFNVILKIKHIVLPLFMRCATVWIKCFALWSHDRPPCPDYQHSWVAIHLVWVLVLTDALCCFMTASGGPSASKQPFLMRPTWRNNRSVEPDLERIFVHLNCYVWVTYLSFKTTMWAERCCSSMYMWRDTKSNNRSWHLYMNQNFNPNPYLPPQNCFKKTQHLVYVSTPIKKKKA